MEELSGFGSTFDGSASYQITVQGTVPGGWSGRLEGMTISRISLQNGTPLTILTGQLSDQAALAGVLNTLYGLRLTIITVNKLPAGSR